MDIYILVIVFLLGLFIGSFLNVVIYLLEKGKRKDLKGRSFCPNCKHELGALDLIPLFSWIFLRARCRYCKKSISVQYPFVELMTGLVFLATYLFINPSLSSATELLATVLLIVINSLLIVVFVYDLKHKIIPDKVIYPAIVLVIGYLLLVVGAEYVVNNVFVINSILYPLIAAFGAGGFFYLLAYVSGGKWMGGGDIKLAFLMGLLLSWPFILAGLFVGFILGALVGVALIALGQKKMGSEIPFGPFLIIGTWVALFWGGSVIQWYLGVIGL